jgi:guanine deaminase
MLETLKLTATLHRSDEMQFGEWPGAEEAFRLATVGGATAAGCGEKLGQLTVGSEADIVAYNLDSSSFYPPSNFLNQLVYAGGGCAIDTVIVAGKVIMSGNRLLTVDEDAVRAELSHRLPEIRETIEGSREAGQVLWPYLEAAYERSWKEWSKISGGGEVGA